MSRDLYGMQFVDVSQFVAEPIRTGIQRVLVKILGNLPRGGVMPFRVVDGRAAILDPVILDVCTRFFDHRTPSPRALVAQEQGIDVAFSEEEDLVRSIGQAPLALLRADRFFFRAQRIINLEAFADPARSRFYIGCPQAYRGKVVHFIHDFLLFERPEMFPHLNWRHAIDHVLLFEAYCAAGGFLVSTEEMQRKAARYFNRPLADVKVVRFGGDVQPSSSSPPQPREATAARRCVVVVGTIEPRKFPLEVASALDELAVRRPELDCVMAGKMGWLSPETHAAVEAIFAGNRVRHLPQLADAELMGLVDTAAVAIYVSRVEGFGLPVIEYAYRGIPQVTNRAVPASQLVCAARAIVLDTVTVESLIAAVERQLDAADDRSPYYSATWADCARAIVKWRGEETVDPAAAIDPLAAWLLSVPLVREMRARGLDWEDLKVAVRSRLFQGNRTMPLLGCSVVVPHETVVETVEQVSEIVSDNLRLIHWADRLAARPLLQEMLRCIMAATHFEAVSRAYTAYLGRPVDARAASEALAIADRPQRLRRILELIHCEEASAYLPEATRVALRSTLGDCMRLLECVCARQIDVLALFEVLGIAAPSLEDVIKSARMHDSGTPGAVIALHYAHRRDARGDSIDALLDAIATVVRERPVLRPAGDRASPVAVGAAGAAVPAAAAADVPLDGVTAVQPLPDAVSRHVPLHSTLLSEGWYAVETGDQTWRWMGKRAAMVNPEPLRRLDYVQLILIMVYGADRPLLTAAIDGAKAQSVIDELQDGQGWLVTVIADPQAPFHEVVTLQAAFTDSPARAEGSSDARELSFAMTECVFVYRLDDAAREERREFAAEGQPEWEAMAAPRR